MFFKTKKYIMATAVVGAVALGTATAAMASGDTDDHFNVPTGTLVTAKGSLVASGTLGGVPVTITCTKVSAHGTTPAKGLSIKVPAKNIKITGCTANVPIGTISFKLFGTWTLAEIDATNDETATEPNTDGASLTIPKVTTGTPPTGGAEFFASAFPSCIVHVADGTTNSPGPVVLSGSYNDAGALTIPSNTIPIDPLNCPSGTATSGTISSNLTATPAISDAS